MVAVRTPMKKRIESPNQVDDHEDGRANAKRYRTKTPRGSIIHSNFKINQNSLQKMAGSTAEKRNGPPSENDMKSFNCKKELKFDSQIYGNTRN